ncbi:MAG: hypothetical protein IPJ84_15350 [Bdellovibrionales bacterium]|nr:hypothetical protein [Bdellovibrionales bacterium]
MSRRAMALVLGLTWCQLGCEFRDAPKVHSESAIRTDLTFNWADDVGPKEATRSFTSVNGELAGASRVAVAVPPKTITIHGVNSEGDCSANIWVGGESSARLDCVAINGQSEITLRGFDLALRDGIDGLHPVRIEVDSSTVEAVNFTIRTLPKSLTLKPAHASLRSYGAGETAGFHRLGEIELERSLPGNLSLRWPTKFQANLRRRLVRHDYDFDFIRCQISQRSVRTDELIPIEVLAVESVETVSEEWPKLFSLDSQVGKLNRESSIGLSLYARHSFLNQVFGSAPFKEVAADTWIEKECSPDRSVYRTLPRGDLRLGPPIPRSTHATVRIGTDEEDPVLEIEVQDIEVADEESIASDENPVRRALTMQRLEIVLANGVK